MPTLNPKLDSVGPDVWSSLRDASGFSIVDVIDFPYPMVDGSRRVGLVTFTAFAAGGGRRTFSEVPIVHDIESDRYDLLGCVVLAPALRRDVAREAVALLSPVMRGEMGKTLEERRKARKTLEVYGC